VWESPSGPTDCGDSRRFEDICSGIVGEPVFVPLERATVVLHVKIVRDAETYVSSIVLQSRGGEILGKRSMVSDSPSCDALSSATALAAVLAIDSLASTAPSSRPSPPLHVPAPPVAHPPPSLWSAEILATAVISWGRLPGDPVPGVGGRVIVAPLPYLATEAAAVVWTSRQTAGAEIAGWRGAVGECPRVRLGIGMTLGACLGLEVDQITGNPIGLQVGQAQTSTWLGAFSSAAVSMSIAHRFVLRADADVALPFQRDYFYYTVGPGAGSAQVIAFQPWIANLDVGLAFGTSIP
jgi:hypothetical protein